MNEFSYISFIQEGLDITKCLPIKISKYSQNTFSCRQLILLLVIRQKLNLSYRRFVQLLEVTKIPDILNLKRIPHYTTLRNFAKRISMKLIDTLLQNTCVSKIHRLAIDSTGFKINTQSEYMALRFGIHTKFKHFTKLTIGVNTQTQQVVSAVVHKAPRNDIKDFMQVIKKVKGRVLSVIADKGFDKKKHHEYVIRDLKAKCLIKVKGKINSRGGNRYRKITVKRFDDKEYSKRNISEMVFSVVKNCYGSKVRSKSMKTRKVEILLRLVGYNLRRVCYWRLYT